MLYTSDDTRKNIFGFAVSYVNSDLNAANSLQKLMTFVKHIQVKFSRLLNDDDETEVFNQI